MHIPMHTPMSTKGAPKIEQKKAIFRSDEPRLHMEYKPVRLRGVGVGADVEPLRPVQQAAQAKVAITAYRP